MALFFEFGNLVGSAGIGWSRISADTDDGIPRFIRQTPYGTPASKVTAFVQSESDESASQKTTELIPSVPCSEEPGLDLAQPAKEIPVGFEIFILNPVTF